MFQPSSLFCIQLETVPVTVLNKMLICSDVEALCPSVHSSFIGGSVATDVLSAQ